MVGRILLALTSFIERTRRFIAVKPSLGRNRERTLILREESSSKTGEQVKPKLILLRIYRE